MLVPEIDDLIGAVGKTPGAAFGRKALHEPVAVFAEFEVGQPTAAWTRKHGLIVARRNGLHYLFPANHSDQPDADRRNEDRGHREHEEEAAGGHLGGLRVDIGSKNVTRNPRGPFDREHALGGNGLAQFPLADRGDCDADQLGKGCHAARLVDRSR